MLTIKNSRKQRSRKAMQIAQSIISHPELFEALVEIYQYCPDSLQDIDLVLDETIDQTLRDTFVNDLTDYFGSSSGGTYGNLRGSIFEELIGLLNAGMLGLCEAPTVNVGRNCDFLDDGKKISSRGHDIDVTFETTVSVQAVECKVGLKNWLLQEGKLCKRSQAKLNYIDEVMTHCQARCYHLAFSFCCMDNEQNFTDAATVLGCRYPYIKLIDRLTLAQRLVSVKGA